MTEGEQSPVEERRTGGGEGEDEHCSRTFPHHGTVGRCRLESKERTDTDQAGSFPYGSRSGCLQPTHKHSFRGPSGQDTNHWDWKCSWTSFISALVSSLLHEVSDIFYPFHHLCVTVRELPCCLRLTLMSALDTGEEGDCDSATCDQDPVRWRIPAMTPR